MEKKFGITAIVTGIASLACAGMVWGSYAFQPAVASNIVANPVPVTSPVSLEASNIAADTLQVTLPISQQAPNTTDSSVPVTSSAVPEALNAAANALQVTSSVGQPVPDTAPGSVLATPLASLEASNTVAAPVAVINNPPAAPVSVVNAAPSIEVSNMKFTAFAQITAGVATLINNVWGAPSGEGFTSGIFRNADGSFGWSWSRQSPALKTGQSSLTPIFPSIRIGGTCFERNSSLNFPAKLADVKDLVFNVGYNYSQKPSGSYDLAYDFFFSEASQPAFKPHIKAEVMIWLDSTATQPAKAYAGSYSDGTSTFALYTWNQADGRTYYSFVLKSNAGSSGKYQVDVRKLLDQINLDPGWLLHGVEFGTEVYNGAGTININQFEINLNGRQIVQ